MKLELKHFGKHAALTIDSRTDVTLVVGQNRVGKTTIRDALEFVLLGTCALRGFALKKDVARYMIHEVANRASVELSVAGWGVRRSMTSSGAQQIQLDRFGNGGWVVVSAAEWAAFLPAVGNTLAVRYALESDALWTDAAARSALLVSLAEKKGLTAEQVLSEMPPHLKAEPVAVAPGSLVQICDVAAMSGFEAADAQAVALRREAKRQLADVGPEPAEVDPIVDGFDVRSAPLESLERGYAEAVEELRLAREAASIDLGRLAERRDAAKARHDEKDAEWAAVSREVWLKFPVDPWAEGEEVGPCPTVAAGDLLERAQQHAGSVRALESQIAEYRRRIGELRESIGEPPMDEIVIVAVPPNRCPVYSFPFACPAKDDDLIKARIDAKLAREFEWEQKAAERAEAEGRIRELGMMIDECESAIVEHREVGQRFLDRARERERLDALTLQLKREVDLARAEMEKAEAQLRKVAATVGPTASQVEMFASQVARRERIAATRRAYDERSRTISKLSRARSELTAAVEWYDAVERELRPEGIEARLASVGAVRLREDLEAAEPFFGEVDITPDFDVTINGRHVAAASKSEQRCAGMALQFAIARAIGLPLIVVDELDALDSHWRGRFAAFALGQIPGSEVDLLALGTADGIPSAPPSGFTTAWVQPGTVTMIEGGVE